VPSATLETTTAATSHSYRGNYAWVQKEDPPDVREYNSLSSQNAQMNPSFEQTLIEVWRQALVENAEVVELGKALRRS